DGHQLALAFDPLGNVDTTIELWDVTSGQPTGSLAGLPGRIYAVAYSPDGQTLAAGSANGSVKLWPITGRGAAQMWTLPHEVHRLAFAHDGQLVAIGLKDGTVQLRQASNGQLVRTLAGHTDLVSGMAFSPAGDRLATASFDDSVKVWDVASGQALETLSGHT